MEESPFLAADALLGEAADWLADLQLPPGHENRHEDDDAICLEQAAANMERAISVLFEAGHERVEVGWDEVGGYAVPSYRTDVIDPEAAAAAAALEVLARDIVLWSRGGPRPALNVALIERVRSGVSLDYSGRLDAERRMQRALADTCDC